MKAGWNGLKKGISDFFVEYLVVVYTRYAD